MKDGSSGIAADLVERLSGVGEIQSKPMFGGFGLRLDGVHFGMVYREEIYFHVDDTLRAELSAQGMSPFTYPHGSGKTITMQNVYTIPNEVVADDEALADLARRSYAVAAAKKSSSAKKRK
jgi:DNA transformation protein